jgi:lysophospholipase L1-like esterase
MTARWIRIVGCAAAGLCLLAGGLELGLRAGLGLGTPPLLRADSTIGYVFQANQDTDRFTNRVRINAYHQRSEDLRTQPDSTFTRILFLGDSVTWGGVLTGQSETIPEATEGQLARRCTAPVEGLNASAGSWGIGNLKAYVERFGLFDSDIVVLQIGTHDLVQAKSTGEIVGRHPSYPNENPTLAIGELWGRYLWPWLEARLPEWGGEASADRSASTAQSARPETRFARNLDRLRAMVEAIRREKVPVVIVHTPNRGEVVGRTAGPAASERRRQFLAVADSLDVPVLNLARGWARRTGVDAFYRDHVHLNERGNNAVADTLARVLSRHVQSLCAGSDP